MSLLLIVLLLLIMLFGTPVTFSLGVVGLIFFVVNGIPLEAFAQRLAVGVDSFPLLAAPFFILAGNLMNNGGITRRIFRFANSLVGHVDGGLGHVNVLGSMIFAGMSGSAFADAAGLGKIEIKAMTEAKYDLEFSAAITAASAVIGPIIPPSIIMVVYGVTAQVPIDKLFLGGIVPGILIGFAEMVMVYFYARKRKYPKNAQFRIKEVLLSFKETFLALLTPLIILGGVLSGVFTATESGAVAALYALILGVFVYKEIPLKDLPGIFLETILTSGVILFIVSTAGIFGWVMAYEQAPQTIANFLVQLSANKYVIMMFLVVLYMVLGCLMEAASIVIMTVPIFVPVLMALNIDLVYFGVITAILMSIGTITPPVGIVMFTICNTTGLPIEKFSKVIWPWVALLVGVVLLLVFVPKLILFIPALLAR